MDEFRKFLKQTAFPTEAQREKNLESFKAEVLDGVDCERCERYTLDIDCWEGYWLCPSCKKFFENLGH